MATARKLPSGNWRVRMYSHTDDVEGKKVDRYKSFTAPTKKEAEFLAAQWKLHAEAVAANPLQYVTFEQGYEAMIEARRDKLSPSTIRGYKTTLPALKNIIDKPISEVAKEDTIKTLISENEEHYKAKSISNQCGLISAVLKFYKLPMPQVEKPKKTTRKKPLPNKNECLKIVQIIQGSDIEGQILLALVHSLRQSEIAAITPADIKDGVLHVTGAVVRDENSKRVYKDDNKTENSDRFITLSDYVFEVITEKAKGIAPNEPIFKETANMVLYHFQRILKANGMYKYTVHDMRHAFAAWQSSKGVKEATIMKHGGWKTAEVMKRIYRYAFDEDDVESLNAANDLASQKTNMTQNPTQPL